MPNDLANLFKPNWTDKGDPIPSLLAMADASLVTLKLAELVAKQKTEELKQYNDQVLIPASEQSFGPVAMGSLIEDNEAQRVQLDQVLRAIAVTRLLMSNWRTNVKAGQLQTHNASNFPAVPQVLAAYIATLSIT